MGSNGSKLLKKTVSSFSGSGFETDVSESSGVVVKPTGNPFVLSRKGSMFFDEDGDLAHEFYVEVLPTKKGSKATMKRVEQNLIPQGEVVHQFPRLNVDFPVILYQA